MKGQGTTDETLRQSQLVAGGELAIKAAGKIHIDIPEVNRQTVAQTIDALVQAEPQLAWLKDMEQRGDIDWRRVKEVHDQWQYSHSGMGTVLTVIIAIVVTVVTWGAASGAIAGAANAGAGTAAAAAGSTMAVGGAVNTALTAAVTSMASNAAINTINNGGDLGKALEQTFSDEAMKGYVTSAVVAGITTGLIDSYFNDSGGSGTNTGAVDVEVSKAGQTTATPTGPSFNLNSLDGIGKFAAYQGSKAVVSAGVDTAINGGSFEENLGAALTSQAIHVVSAVAFNELGGWAKETGIADGSIEKIAVKALVGGLISQAATGDFAAGALAAGANEALIDKLAQLVDNDPALISMASQLVGAVSAGLSGGDPNLTSNIALYDTQYNYLNHNKPNFATLSEKEQYERAVAECGNGNPQACNTQKELTLLSNQRDQQLSNACGSNGNPGTCNLLIQQAIQMGNLVYGSQGQLVWANSPDTNFPLNVATLGATPTNPVYENSYHYQQTQSLQQGLIVGSAVVGGELLTGGSALAGLGLGAGFDMAGQTFKILTGNQDDYRIAQTVIAGTMGALFLPMAGRSILGNAAVGGLIGGANTTMTNAWYGENASVSDAALYGSFFGGLGIPTGRWATGQLQGKLPLFVGKIPYNPALPILVQNVKPNPAPGQAGAGAQQIISNIPSFFGSKEGDKKQP